MNIFKEMVLAVYDFKSYKGFLNNRKGKVFGFGVMLMLIYWFLTVGIAFIQLFAGSGGIKQEINEIVPEFELEDGYLWVERVIEYEENGMYINIDTDPDSYFYDASEIREFLYDYTQVILMDSEKVIIKNNGEIQQYYFDELGNAEFSKKDLMAFLPYVYVCLFIAMIFSYIWMTALFFFGVIFVALLGMIVASCMKCQFTFGELYLLGVYSRVLPLLIKAAVSFLPFNIPFFWVFNFGISLFILARAMQKMKEQRLQGPLEFSTNNGGNGYNNGNEYNNGYYNNSNGGGNFTGNYNVDNNYNNGSGNNSNSYNNNSYNGNGTENTGNNNNRSDGNDFSWMK